MKLLFVTVATLTVFCVGFCKPVSEDSVEYLQEVAYTHFGLCDENLCKDIQIPEEDAAEETTNTHPYMFNSTNDGSGNYYFQFDTPDIQRYEVGELKNSGTDNEIQAVRGKYVEKFVNGDGAYVIRTIGYTADENGYRPFIISIISLLSSHDTLPGGPKGPKSEISSAALGSLIGGNSVG